MLCCVGKSKAREIDGLMGKQVAPVFKWCLNDLKKKLSDKSYSKDNRLHLLASSH